jgi:hypothetical protein
MAPPAGEAASRHKVPSSCHPAVNDHLHPTIEPDRLAAAVLLLKFSKLRSACKPVSSGTGQSRRSEEQDQRAIIDLTMLPSAP